MIEKQKVKSIKENIQQLYTEDSKPWVIGYSGGKDSTATLQFIMYALSELSEDKLTKEVHVLSNDTLVENPSVVEYLDEQLELIEKAGKKHLFGHAPHMFKVKKVVPKIEDRFWINMIGKGYPAPNRWFRWCTERMKIRPTNDYIVQQVSQYGKVIVVLGSRKAESTNRKKSMERYDLESISGSKLKKHTLPNSWMYAPIEDLTTNEVWAYLMAVPSYWKGDNKRLLTMYKNASDDAAECPLVIDTSTSSCGNSRFGCWVCTVVSRDKSMENLIDNGEDWMIPMLEFRDYLAEIRNSPDKRYPESLVNPKQKGAFLPEVRAELLKRVLEIEDQVGFEVMSKQELAAIQLQWEYHGIFDYSVSKIYKKVKNKSLGLSDKSLEKKEQDAFKLLKKVSKKYDVKAEHIRELLIVEQEKANYLRRRNVFDDIQKKIEQFTKNH